MKKIIISSNTSWSIYNFRLELIKSLTKKYKVIIAAPKDEYSIKLENLGFDFYATPMASSSISIGVDFITLKEYISIINKVKPDYYLGFTAKPNIYGGLIASLFGAKVVNNIAGLGRAFSNAGLLQWMMKLLYKVSLYRSYHVFFQNKDDLNLFEKNGLINNASHSVLPGSGVNIQRFIPKRNNKNEIHAALGFVFLFSARLLLEKGVLEFIDAAKKIKTEFPEVECRILGKYEGTQDELTAADLSLACEQQWINYLGTTDNVVAVLQAADCFVLPSYYREGVPRSLLEAGSCGLPLITTDSVGCRETVIDGVNGYLIPPRDSHALYNAMKKMILLSTEERKQMGLASRHYIVEHFSEEIVLQQYQKVLTEK